MANPSTLSTARLAACTPCGTTWLLRPDLPNCISCGKPPDGVIEFRPVQDQLVDTYVADPYAPPPASDEPTVWAVECPRCHGDLDIVVSDESIGLAIREPTPGDSSSANDPAERKEASSESAPASDQPPAGEQASTPEAPAGTPAEEAREPEHAEQTA